MKSTVRSALPSPSPLKYSSLLRLLPDYFKPVVQRGATDEAAWSALYTKYQSAHSMEYAELAQRLTGDLPAGWRDALPPKSALPTAPQATLKSSGIAATALFPQVQQFHGGVRGPHGVDVSCIGMGKLSPETGLGDSGGRQILYGIREFPMISISNGMNAYQNGMIVP